MSEPCLIILDGRKKRGQPPIYGVPLSKKIEIWVTDAQFNDLKSVAESENKKNAQVVRDAVLEYVNTCKEQITGASNE